MPNKTTQILKEFRKKFSYQGHGVWWREGITEVDEDDELVSTNRQGYAIPEEMEKFITEALSQQQQEDYQQSKKLEQLLRLAYRAGQDSVSVMKVINSGMAKPSHYCEDEPCKHDIEETSTAEDEAVNKLINL